MIPRVLTTRFGTPGYKDLRFEFNLMHDDPWGDSLSWWFAIAETLYHSGHDLPGEWEFHDSPAHINRWTHYITGDWLNQLVTEYLEQGRVTADDLMNFGHVLFRYLNILRDAGKDY